MSEMPSSSARQAHQFLIPSLRGRLGVLVSPRSLDQGNSRPARLLRCSTASRGAHFATTTIVPTPGAGSAGFPTCGVAPSRLSLRQFNGARVCDPQQPSNAKIHSRAAAAATSGGCCGSQTRAPRVAAVPRRVGTMVVRSRCARLHSGKSASRHCPGARTVPVRSRHAKQGAL
jgi:hypothetical protein